MARKERLATLDVGTSKICATIAEVHEDGTIDLLGIGVSPSLGLRKGVVIDIERNAQAVRLAIERAEQMAGVRVGDIWVGIGGPHVASQNAHGMVAVTGEKKEIKQSDIKRVIEASQVISFPPGREILHVLPSEFIVDGNRGIKDPEGMSGVRLEVHSHIVTVSSTSLENLIKSVERSNVYVQGVVLSILAASEAILTEDEKELGVVLIDMGGGTTDLAIFKDGSLVFAKMLPVGGTHVTNDIAVGLRTAVKSAEEIKIKYGHACIKEDCQDNIKVLSASGKEESVISQKTLLQIIEPRITEIFRLANKEIEDSGYVGLTPGGVVLTGGSSLLSGVDELGSAIMGLPVRLGQPENIKGLSELAEGASREANLDYILTKPNFSTAVGLLNHDSGHERDKLQMIEMIWSYIKKITNKIKDTF